jgi:hypothetical protein
VFEPEQRRDTEDIEFDFFDDAPTREASQREGAPPRRRRLPRRPTGGGLPPQQLRLAALVTGLVILVVLLIFWVSSCRDDKKGAYENYMDDVSQVTSASDRVGRDLKAAIATPGIKLADLQQKLEGLRAQQAQLVTQAEDLSPPGPLRDEQESLVEVMQLRVSGLAGLAQGFSQAGQSGGAVATGRDLAGQAQRFVASDVVYDDLFAARSRAVMQEEGVTGVDVPTSTFLDTPELAQTAAWTSLVRRLTESPKSGGLHGNQIVGVVVKPGGKRLSPTGQNEVPASNETKFLVSVRNSGDSLETGVKVTLTIVQSPKPLPQEKTIDLIQPGQTKVLTFNQPGGIAIAQESKLRVNVEPVSGETNTSNNTAEYTVIFVF